MFKRVKTLTLSSEEGVFSIVYRRPSQQTVSRIVGIGQRLAIELMKVPSEGKSESKAMVEATELATSEDFLRRSVDSKREVASILSQLIMRIVNEDEQSIVLEGPEGKQIEDTWEKLCEDHRIDCLMLHYDLLVDPLVGALTETTSVEVLGKSRKPQPDPT